MYGIDSNAIPTIDRQRRSLESISSERSSQKTLFEHRSYIFVSKNMIKYTFKGDQ